MEDLRLIMRMMDITTWKIADAVGVSEMTIYRWLRIYDPEHHEKIAKVIQKIIVDENMQDRLKEVQNTLKDLINMMDGLK